MKINFNWEENDNAWLEHETICSNTILNHKFIQKLKPVVEGKFNYVSLTDDIHLRQSIPSSNLIYHRHVF